MKLRTLFFCFLAVALLAGYSLAQVATTGTIRVIVVDAQGARLPGAIVIAEAPDHSCVAFTCSHYT